MHPFRTTERVCPKGRSRFSLSLSSLGFYIHALRRSVNHHRCRSPGARGGEGASLVLFTTGAPYGKKVEKARRKRQQATFCLLFLIHKPLQIARARCVCTRIYAYSFLPSSLSSLARTVICCGRDGAEIRGIRIVNIYRFFERLCELLWLDAEWNLSGWRYEMKLEKWI